LTSKPEKKTPPYELIGSASLDFERMNVEFISLATRLATTVKLTSFPALP